MSDDKWYFSKETLYNSPSRRSGYEPDRELSCRQQAANFIQDMGQRLQVSQLCINTAIVYMHRFYVFHSFAAFHRNAMAAASLFLAAKVEEQPRKLEHVIKVAHLCLHRENLNLETKSELYLEQAQDLVFNENVLLQTLGFDVAIDHPHTHVVRCCDLVRASKDLAQTSYFMASNSLHLTTMCLMYKPTVVACFCIHLACKWSSWEIPKSNEGKDWFWYVDKTVTLELLERLTTEFFAIFEKCPTKLKRKLRSMNQNSSPGLSSSLPMGNDGIQFDDLKKLPEHENAKLLEGLFPVHVSTQPATEKSLPSLNAPQPVHHQKVIEYKEYKEKRERERLEKERLEKEKHMQSREGMSSSHHPQKVGQNISHSGSQSRSSGQGVHKNYQATHPQSSNVHFNRDNPLLLGRDSSHHGSVNQSFTATTKDPTSSSGYTKHVSQSSDNRERDHGSFVQQYQSNPNMQPSYQNYPHPPEVKTKNMQHQYSGDPSQQHSQSYNYNHSQRDYQSANQRDNVRDIDPHPHAKDITSGIRDIISQTSQSHREKELSDRKEREKAKSSMYLFASPYKQAPVKSGREPGKNYNTNETSDKKFDNDPARTQKKHEFPHNDLQTVDHYNTKINDNLNDMNMSKSDYGQMAVINEQVNMKNESINKKVDVRKEHFMSVKKDSFSKTESKGDARVDHKNLQYGSHKYSPMDKPLSSQSHAQNKEQEAKFRLHHSSNKVIDAPFTKHEKQPSSHMLPGDGYKKSADRTQRKPADDSQVRHMGVNVEPGAKPNSLQKVGDRGQQRESSSKESNEKNKYNTSIHDDGAEPKKVKSTATVQPMKHYESAIKPETQLDYDKTNRHSSKVTTDEYSKKNLGNLRGYHKQKSHEFGAPGSLSSLLSDNNIMSSSKTTSIFSPDSKIPPQNILSALEKDTKNNLSLQVSPPSVAQVKAINQTPTKVVRSSIFSPPLPKNNTQSTPTQRMRTSSSGSSSEPELIPVLTKLEETPGYENIMQDKKIALLPTKSDSMPTVETRHSKSLLTDTDKLSSGYAREARGSQGNAGIKSTQHMPMLDHDTSKTSTDVKSKDYGLDIKPQVEPVLLKEEQFRDEEQTCNISSKKSNPSFDDVKHSSTSTVNLLGIEKMVDTSISQSKPNLTAYNSSGATSAFNISSSPPSYSPITVPSSLPDNESQISTISAIKEEFDSPSEQLKKLEKKKKKDKHKHKQKDKDKDKSERKKEKKKHKDKDKERPEKSKDSKVDKSKESDVGLEAPIKITIPKDKLGFTETAGLKLKIPKERLKNEDSEAGTSGGLKIKISKEVIGSYSSHGDHKSSSKKRQRSPKPHDMTPAKVPKSTDKRSSSKSSHSDKNYKPSSNKHSVNKF